MSFVAGLICFKIAEIVVFNMIDSGAFWGIPIIGNIFAIWTTYVLILRNEHAFYIDKQLVLFR